MLGNSMAVPRLTSLPCLASSSDCAVIKFCFAFPYTSIRLSLGILSLVMLFIFLGPVCFPLPSPSSSVFLSEFILLADSPTFPSFLLLCRDSLTFSDSHSYSLCALYLSSHSSLYVLGCIIYSFLFYVSHFSFPQSFSIFLV